MGERVETNLIGVAGEYLVAAELSRRGWIATVTLKNAKGIDILAFKAPRGPGSIAIQTKTTGSTSWVLPQHDPTRVRGADEYLVLVMLRDLDARPTFYVMPSAVGDRIVEWHESEFVSRKGKSPTMNTVNPAWVSGFVEAWELLDDPGPAWDRIGDRYR